MISFYLKAKEKHAAVCHYQSVIFIKTYLALLTILNLLLCLLCIFVFIWSLKFYQLPHRLIITQWCQPNQVLTRKWEPCSRERWVNIPGEELNSKQSFFITRKITKPKKGGLKTILTENLDTLKKMCRWEDSNGRGIGDYGQPHVPPATGVRLWADPSLEFWEEESGKVQSESSLTLL